MADEHIQDPQKMDWEILPFKFHDLAKSILIAEIRVMIRRLQDNGDFPLPDEVHLEELDIRMLKFIKNQLRDTLRTLGGGR
jgi:hypothetical protein